MVSSGGGGSARAPQQAIPAGAISDYGTSTPFQPEYTSVLNKSGWTTPEMIDQGLAAGAQAQAARAAPPPSDGGMFGGNAGYQRSLLAAMMNKTPANPALAERVARMSMMPGFQGSNLGAVFAPAPLPKPGAGASMADQMLYQLASQGRTPVASGGGYRPQGNAVGAYGGGGGRGSPSRGGYSSSR